MSEQPKKKLPLIKIFVVKGTTFEELAKKMQSTRRKLHKQGYQVSFEPIHEHIQQSEYDAGGRVAGGYMIHAILQQPEPPFMSFFGLPDENEGKPFTEKTSKFINTALSKLSNQDPSIAMKELPAIVPTVTTGFTTADLTDVAKEIEDDCITMGEKHVETCNTHKAYKLIAATLRESLRHSVQ